MSALYYIKNSKLFQGWIELKDTYDLIEHLIEK